MIHRVDLETFLFCGHDQYTPHRCIFLLVVNATPNQFFCRIYHIFHPQPRRDESNLLGLSCNAFLRFGVSPALATKGCPGWQPLGY